MSMKWSWLDKATADVLKSEENLYLLNADYDEMETPHKITTVFLLSGVHGQHGRPQDFNASARQLGRADKPGYDDMRRTCECQRMCVIFWRNKLDTYKLQLFLQVDRHDSRCPVST